MTCSSYRPRTTVRLSLATGLILAMFATTLATGQSFSSGSDGTDGALTFAAGAGEIDFDPVALGIDVDGDRIFHFTTITLPAGTTVRLRASILGEGRPVFWLAQGDVLIDGMLDLDGRNGHSWTAPATASEAGAGGFGGGSGQTLTEPGHAGNGPGGGGASATGAGGGAGHLLPGLSNLPNAGDPGVAYGNRFLRPLFGGSGGGGGSLVGTGNGAGGGAGGGALLIASSTTVTLNGTISAKGGNGGSVTFSVHEFGGGGSGGGVRLMANGVDGTGTINVSGGLTSNFQGHSDGSAGRIRIEAFRGRFEQGTATPINSVTKASPGAVFLPASAPRVTITAVDGVPVAALPTGSFEMPDVIVDADSGVTIDVSASNIPLGTQVQLILNPEDGSAVTVVSTPLAGTVANSTATAGPVVLPNGFTRFVVTASWTP